MESITFTWHALANVSQVLNMQALVHRAAFYVTKFTPFHTLTKQQHRTAFLLRKVTSSIGMLTNINGLFLKPKTSRHIQKLIYVKN